MLVSVGAGHGVLQVEPDAMSGELVVRGRVAAPAGGGGTVQGGAAAGTVDWCVYTTVAL